MKKLKSLFNSSNNSLSGAEGGKDGASAGQKGSAKNGSPSLTEVQKTSLPQQQPNQSKINQASASKGLGVTVNPVPDSKTFKASMQSTDQDPVLFPFQKQNYKFLKKLGSGAYATVKEALHLPSNTHVAVKMIEKMRMRNREERMRGEIEILLKVKHQNLLSLLDWGFGRSTLYLVTELAAGGELFGRILEVGVFYEHDAATITYALIDGIKHLHSLDIIHRDIKPENIFLRDPTHKDYTNVILGDYGISKMLDESKRFLRTKVGSPGYMAPEVLMDRPYGKTADIWSIGVVTYILLSGHMPWRGSGDFNSELDAILQSPLSFDAPNWRKVSQEAMDFVRHCLVLDPKNRYDATTALNHPWLAHARQVETKKLLGDAMVDLFPDVKEGLEETPDYEMQEASSRSRHGSTDSMATSGFGSFASAASNQSHHSLPSLA